MQRKIREMEAEAWGGIPFDPRPTPSRLERELGVAYRWAGCSEGWVGVGGWRGSEFFLGTKGCCC